MVFIRSAECSSRSTGSGEECNEASAGSQKEKLTFREVVYKEILPLYLSIGVSKEEFMDSTPAELKPYLEAEKIRQKEKTLSFGKRAFMKHQPHSQLLQML